MTPLFLEHVLLDKYYEKYWLCDICVTKFNIDKQGELHFDPVMREFLNEKDDQLDKLEDDGTKVELEPGIKNLIFPVCRECLLEKYGSVIQKYEKHPEKLKQISVRN